MQIKFLYFFLEKFYLSIFSQNFCVLSIINGLGDFGRRAPAKITRLPRFIEMIQFFVYVNT